MFVQCSFQNCVCVWERGGGESVCLSRVSLQCWALSGGSSPDQNKERSLYEYTSANTFQDAAQQHVGPLSLCYHPQSFGFFICGGHPETLTYSGPVNEETLDHCIFYACQIIHNYPGTFERVWQSVIRCVHACLDQVEDILSIGYELWLVKQYKFGTY